MKRIVTLLISLALIMTPGLTGCEAKATPSPTAGESPSVTTPTLAPSPGAKSGTKLPVGTLVVNITDAPPKEEITAVILTVSRLEVHQALAEMEQGQQNTPFLSPSPSPVRKQEQQETQQGEDAWIAIEIPGGSKTFDLLKIKGVEDILAEGELTSGKYTQIRLTIDKAEVATNGGEPQPATVPSGELKFVHPFEIKTGETTTILIDFDAEKSVNITGNNSIMVKPVVKLVTK